MISTKHITKNVLDIINKKFDIIDSIEFKDFDYDFSVLKSFFKRNYKEYYSPDEKILVEHMDTDYYFDECTVGVNLRNFFQLLNENDIPPSVLILYTNHFGLQKEIDLLCKLFDKNDRPLIIESFIGNNHWDNKATINVNHDFNKINYNAMCIMNEIRSHRSALYHSLKCIDDSKITIQLTNKNNVD